MMRVGVLGRITSGTEQGGYVRVQDDRHRSGGFLILTGADRGLTYGGGDCWVDSPETLEQFAREARWVIDWEEGPEPPGD